MSTAVPRAFLTCTHSNKDLRATVNHLDVLVVHQAAHDSDGGVALCGADPRSLRHLSPHATWPVFAPPGVMAGDVKCQQVTVLEGEIKHLLSCWDFVMTLDVHSFIFYEETKSGSKVRHKMLPGK